MKKLKKEKSRRSSSVSPVGDHQGNVVSASNTGRDRTALRKLEEKLHQEIEERKRAEKTLADFTAMVVHDLRSPLSNVVSIAESLQDGLFGPVNEQQHKWLWKIEANCKSLIEQVSDFLDLSKIEARHIELVKKPVDRQKLRAQRNRPGISDL